MRLEGGAPVLGLVSIKEEEETRALSLSLSLPHEDTAGRQLSASQEESLH